MPAKNYPIKIYIVEDHRFMQRAMCEFLDQLPDMTVCGAATTVQEALLQLRDLTVDLVLVDLSLPDKNGIELVRVLQQWWPPLPCLIFSSYDDVTYIQQAQAAGARGYLFKGEPPELLVAIRHVLAGNTYFSAAMSKPCPELVQPTLPTP
jgi:two-component system, NarL family, invasion response regulator UvrY